MSKFQTGDRVQLDDEYNPESATGVVTRVNARDLWVDGVKSSGGYKVKWDDGWVDDPEVYYYDSELKKAEEK